MMALQYIIGTLFLAAGIIYAVYILKDAITDKAAFNAQPGNLKVIMIAETIVYFFCTIGISDFVMNTITIRRLKLAEPETLPDCLITAGIVPGAFISFLYMRNAGAMDNLTLLVFMICMAVGSFLGSRAVGQMKGETIRRAMVALLSLSVLVLIARMIMTQGAANTEVALRGAKLVILALTTLVFGFTNMLGIPAKPFLTTALLLLGLSPIATLALILGAVPISVVTGGINVVRRKRYNKKHAVSAVTAGCAAAFVGCMLAISLNAAALNVILIAVIIVAIISLIKK
ncbi:MAG: hypothetical protein K5653_05625 [Clostridiales bacterium]|nr:hypothetical protein [Clostridiales bacterium]